MSGIILPSSISGRVGKEVQQGQQEVVRTAIDAGLFGRPVTPLIPSPHCPVPIQSNPPRTTLPSEFPSTRGPDQPSDSIPLLVYPAEMQSSVTYSHESTHQPTPRRMQNYHYIGNDSLSSTMFQHSSGPTPSNFVPPLSPRSHTTRPAANQLSAPETAFLMLDSTISTNDQLFMGPQWGRDYTHNTSTSEQKTSPSQIPYQNTQRSAVDIPPCDPNGAVPLPGLKQTNSPSFYQTNDQYQPSSSTGFQGNNLLYLPVSTEKPLAHTPIAEAPSPPPLTAAEEDWILSIESSMRSSPTSWRSAEHWGGTGLFSAAAPTSLPRWNDTGATFFAPARQTDLSPSGSQHLGVNSSRRLGIQKSLSFDIGNSRPSTFEVVPGQSMRHLSRRDKSVNFPVERVSPQSRSTVSSTTSSDVAQASQQPKPISRRSRKRFHDPEQAAGSRLDAPISVTCEWDGCGEHLVTVEGFRKHFIKSLPGSGPSRHNLSTGKDKKTKTTCLWGDCLKPVTCLWRHLWETHGGFQRSKRRRL